MRVCAAGELIFQNLTRLRLAGFPAVPAVQPYYSTLGCGSSVLLARDRVIPPGGASCGSRAVPLLRGVLARSPLAPSPGSCPQRELANMGAGASAESNDDWDRCVLQRLRALEKGPRFEPGC